MTGGGVWDDMPMPPWPADGELPPPGDAAFDALLDRAPLPGDAAAGLHQLAAAFGELHAAPVPSEPVAEQRAVAAFRAVVSRPPAPSRPAQSRLGRRRLARSRPGRRRARVPRISARIAAIGAAVVVSLGGAAAAAAYTGALPGMLHRLTHHPASPAVTAPQSPGQPTTESRSAAPGTGHGQCVAYQHALAHGSPSQQARALRKLVAAAGGQGNVTAYCAGVVEPKPATGGQPTHPTHPAHPTHPTHPSHPAHPTHPPHPSRGSK